VSQSWGKSSPAAGAKEPLVTPAAGEGPRTITCALLEKESASGPDPGAKEAAGFRPPTDYYPPRPKPGYFRLAPADSLPLTLAGTSVISFMECGEQRQLPVESMQSCGVITLRPRPGAVPRLPETLVPMSKCVFQGAIQHVTANIEETLDSVPVPSHLLLLHHSFGDNLVDCRLDEPGRDPLSRTVTLSIIGHRICVQLQVANHIRKRVLQLL
jgi:hypothetical protein